MRGYISGERELRRAEGDVNPQAKAVYSNAILTRIVRREFEIRGQELRQCRVCLWPMLRKVGMEYRRCRRCRL